MPSRYLVGDVLVVIVSLIAAALLLIQALSYADDSDNGASPPDTTLRIGFLQTLDSLNPYIGLNDASYVFYGMVYDSLFSIDNDMNPTSNLALSAWKVPESDPLMALSGEPYGSVWEYNLTHNAYWHDGVQFTANDVVYNVWLIAEQTHYNTMWAYQPYSYFMKEAEAIGNFTARIHFWDRGTGEPLPVSWGSAITVPMLPKHLLEQLTYSDIGMNWHGVFNDTMSPGVPIVGTGPFKATTDIYSDWIRGDHVTLVRNEDYHGHADRGVEIHFDKVQLRFFQDSTSISLALRIHDLEIARLPPNAFNAMDKGVRAGELRDIVTMNCPDPRGTFIDYVFSLKDSGDNPSMLDPVIRTAMYKATDKQYIISNFYGNLAQEGTTLISPADAKWHYEPTSIEKAMFEYDLTAASELLESNGYIDTDDDGIRECTNGSLAVLMGYVDEGKKLVFELGVDINYLEQRDIAQYLKTQYSQIGISLDVKVMDPLTLGCMGCYDRPGQLVWYWSGETDPNWMLFVESQRAWNSWSDNFYTNPAYEENYTLSVTTLNESDRKVYTDNCQRIFYNDSGYIIMFYPNSTYAWRNDTFSGWGDWIEHPGRNLDAFWGANPLFFDLMPLSRPRVFIDGPFYLFGAGAAVAIVVAIVVSAVLWRRRPGKLTGPKLP